MDKQFYVENRKNIMEKIEDNSVVLLFSGAAPHRSADSDYDYIINRNFYYMVGIDRENIIYMASKINGKVDESLFIEKPDSFKEAWTGKMLTDEEAKEISGIEGVKYLTSFEALLNRNLMFSSVENLYLDIEHNQWDQPLDISHKYAEDVKKKFPFINIKNVYQLICSERQIKSPCEIEDIKRAIDITKEGIYNMMKNARPGMMEYEIEAYYDFALKSRGVRQPGFTSIIGSGENGAVLHYSSNDCKTEENSLVLCDVGAEYGKYSADITRTFPVSGRFTNRQKEVYNVVLKANIEVIKSMKQGVPMRSINDIAKKVLADGCRKLGLIKEDSEISKYYFHGIGHSLGLDTHDVGKSDGELKAGMVYTVEPGLYIKEEGIGIRIEDDVLITEDGCEVLSKDIIKTVEEIEEFMKNR